ncbi:MAG: ferritin family protein [Deltaproteobacteria bacterium]|nr:ferritin family protein [Deltaproteobacteria bacterium]
MGNEFRDVDDILDFAIAREQEAHDFYKGLADKMDKPQMKKVFDQFAREELGHKSKLEGVKEGKRMLASKREIMDLKMSDYLVAEPEAEGELDYQQALILAMKKEKVAYLLYSNLADRVDDGGLKDLFSSLAQEEAKHKLRFEVEYDDVILTEN